MAPKTQTEKVEAGEAVESYFRDGHEGTVQEASAEHIIIRDIPRSGGAHMLPMGMGALEVLNENWGEHDITYVPDGTDRFGKQEQKVIITSE